MRFFSPLPPVYRLVCKLLNWGLRILFRMELRGLENIPRSGACILAANHASFLDPPAVATGIRFRMVHYMARDTLFHNWFLGWLLPRVGVIPINRNKGDLAALRTGIRVLQEGHILGVFPEGTRTLDGQLQPPKGGIGFLIVKSKSPVVPCYVAGSYDAWPKGRSLFRCHKLRVFYGPVITAEEIRVEAAGRPSDAYLAVAELIMARIAALRDQARRET